LDEIRGNQVFLGIPFKCDSSYCYYIIGTLDSSNKLNLYLIANVAQQCECKIADKIEIDGDSYNFNCHLLDYSTSDVKITCFSQNNVSKKIISSNYIINLSSQKIIKASTKSADNNGGQIIKSYLSNDGSTALVCAFDEENNYDCKTFDINNNNWINNNIVLDNCMNSLSSLNLDKINDSNEYYLYCLQPSNKLKAIKLNSNFEIINSEENGVYSLNEAITNDCNQYSLISLVKNNNDNIDYIIFCDTKILKYQIEKISDFSTTIIQKTTMPLFHTSLITIEPTKTSSIHSPQTKTSFATFHSTKMSSSIIPTKSSTITLPSTKISLIIPQQIKSSLVISSFREFNNDIEVSIIQKISYKKKEEIINNLKDFMKNYTNGSIYEIFGNDYAIKISPINTKKYNNISSYIDFSNCENLLRQKNELSSSNCLTVYQIEIDNKYAQSLVNEIEYAVFDENNVQLDLSACKGEIIQINYQIKNISLIDLDKINYYH
jgi:hypothetical protein